ncbi:MAG: glycosyltransferase family 39 protein [Candidatus Microgenomates bacterium]|jgi:4-amino-4-deoxy-L-arabinose transferase-like glycosyltransferase
MSKKLNLILLFLIIAAGTFLRIYKIGSNYYFTGELGKEFLYIRQYVQNGGLPLVGLPTSHVWLRYGPVYYWILIPLVRIFGQSPFILFWLALTVSMIGIFITYFVFSKIAGQKFAVILSFFVSLSPLWIWITRLSKLHTFFFILIPLVIYSLYKIWHKEKKYVFWLGFFFGLLFSFHFSQIPLFLVFFGVFWVRRKILKVSDYFKFVIGLILPNITILIYDAGQNFSMVKNLILWIPYRFAGFAGLYPKNNFDVVSGGTTLQAFNEFLGRNLFWDNRFWILGSIIFIVLFAVFVFQNYKKFVKDFFVFYLISSTVVQFFALVIHTSPPIHYFLPVFLNFGLLFSFFVCEYWEKRSVKFLTTILFILIFVASILGLNNEHVNDVDYIPLKIQEGVASAIVKDANGTPFSLIRLGPYDYFPENYDQNYQFLILTKGGKIDPSAKKKYIIYDVGDVTVERND